MNTAFKKGGDSMENYIYTELLPIEKQRVSIMKRFIIYCKTQFGEFPDYTITEISKLTKKELYGLLRSYFYNEDSSKDLNKFKMLYNSQFALLI